MIDSKDDALYYGLDEEVWKRHNNCWDRKQVSGCLGLGVLSGVREVFYILAVVVVTRLKMPVKFQKGRNSLCLNYTSINWCFRIGGSLKPLPRFGEFFQLLTSFHMLVDRYFAVYWYFILTAFCCLSVFYFDLSFACFALGVRRRDKGAPHNGSFPYHAFGSPIKKSCSGIPTPSVLHGQYPPGDPSPGHQAPTVATSLRASSHRQFP